MDKLLVVLILSTCCALYVSGFFLEKKHGCDAKPCKHDAKCIQDRNDKDKYTCECKGEYHGVHCETKNGCYSKPCKKGICKNDFKNPSKFTCKCEKDYVGEHCDTEDPCLPKKGYCKNSAKCTLDNKFKPHCTCTPGYGSKHCEKKNCTIEKYSLKQAEKHSAKLYIDKSVEANFKAVDAVAKECKAKIHVLKSFIIHPQKQMRHDIKDLNHAGLYIGEAFSFEIYDDHNKLVCNEVCLKKIPIPNTEAKCFIDGITKKGWKWSILTPSTISTEHPAYYTPAYQVRREERQIGCSDMKF